MQHQAPLEQWTENWLALAHGSQQLLETLSHKQETPQSLPDQLHIGSAFFQLYAQLWSDPQKMITLQTEWWEDVLSLMQQNAERLVGNEATPIIEPDRKDKRFKDASWRDLPAFDFIKQFYLLASKRIDQVVQEAEGLDAHTAHKVAFYTRQFIDALSPSNFLFTNPEALKVTLETQGENLVRGMEHLVKDVASGRISMTDVEAFEIGKNIATTPGKVVFRNELIELLQYTPTTKEVFEKPLLLIPAWINKYYIFDLKPEHSFVRWLVDQGYTTFVISWVNPDASQSHKSFDDYMLEGPLAALETIQKITGQMDVNAIGYCLGGTLLAITQAWLAVQGKKSFASTTYLTTLTDFSEAGDLSVFVDEAQLQQMESRMNAKGFLDGKEMAQTFNLLRANDLIWYFVVNNYLLGKDPFPFDLLHWNTDATCMPAKMHSFYLRSMYQNNLLAKPDGLTIAGQKIDLRKITTPSYMLSTHEDHIAPWKSTYKATQLFSGPMKFVLSDSGHVAGVINPPVKHKYCFWTAGNDHPASADDWFKQATKTGGSWWSDWAAWSAAFSGAKIPATPIVKNALADAPGTYVRSQQ